MSSRTEKTRQLLLAAAWKRLGRGDPAHLADVASDAGVSRQALYLHFRSRAGLLIALTQHIDEALGLHAMLRDVDAIAEPDERLLASLRVTAKYAPKIQVVAMALVRLGAEDADARAAIDERMEFRRKGLSKIVSAVARAGRLNREWDVRRATDALWASGAPQTWEMLVTERGWSHEEFERWLVHLGKAILK